MFREISQPSFNSECRIIGITGGIGAGKSVVARVVQLLGFPVYDCDRRAAEIMNSSPEVHVRLVEAFGKRVIPNGHIDRKYLSELVFSNKEALDKLNSIVHPAVIADIKSWAKNVMPYGRVSQTSYIFIETAILYESHLDSLVDAVWYVKANEDIRISRVMERSGLTREQVERRIASQRNEHDNSSHKPTFDIINDGLTPVLPQILALLK